MIVALLVAGVILLAGAVVLLAAALAAERRHSRERPAGPRAAAVSPVAEGFTRDSELRHLLGLLSHELRSPLGAIVGYQELLTDGLLGPLPDRALDAIRRIGTSGGQLRHLIDGLTDLLVPERDVTLDLQQVDGAAAASVAADSARSLAAGRSVQLEVQVSEPLPALVTDATRLAAALDLTIGAAVRGSPGAKLTLSFTNDAGALVAQVDGTALDPVRDGPIAWGDVGGAGGSAPGADRASAGGGSDGGHTATGADPFAGSPVRSGAGLRLAMAARMAEILGGALTVEGHAPTSVRLRVPSAPIDAEAARAVGRSAGGA